jgi:hypothetical protein
MMMMMMMMIIIIIIIIIGRQTQTPISLTGFFYTSVPDPDSIITNLRIFLSLSYSIFSPTMGKSKCPYELSETSHF